MDGVSVLFVLLYFFLTPSLVPLGSKGEDNIKRDYVIVSLFLKTDAKSVGGVFGSIVGGVAGGVKRLSIDFMAFKFPVLPYTYLRLCTAK